MLPLDWPDLDLDDRQATVIGKGGDARDVMWTVRTSRTLQTIRPDHSTGPVFTTSRRRTDVVVSDRSPEGYARLSYRRAHELFPEATGGEYTLHHLRHTRLTELADAKTPGARAAAHLRPPLPSRAHQHLPACLRSCPARRH